MPTDRFFIAPLDADSGLQRNVKPWLISDKAFSTLNNAYVFRGRVRKRFGSRWLGNTQAETRLRVNIGTVPGGGNFVGTTPLSAGVPIVTPAVGQMFSIGNQVFTVNVLGSPANMLRSDENAFAATFDTTTGAVNIVTTIGIGLPVYYYPALPVMGLISYESGNAVAEQLIAFDTRFSYQYANGWERLDVETTPGAAFWTGDDSQFFWGYTYFGSDAFTKLLFVTNFNELEPLSMRYLSGGEWNAFAPLVTATDRMFAARILVPFKNRLLAFNVWTGAVLPGDNYINRVLWCQIGSPIAVDAWRQDIPGKGGGLDAPLSEAIVTVEFIRDRLIVFFERSTWELVYTSNQALPFAWQQINTELGAESTFSVVPFDKVAIGIGNVGIHACNGTNVERIDDKIPDEVFQIHNIDGGVERVYGIRDYYTEMIYWTFPSTEASADYPFPNRVLTYNYKNNTWAFNDDSITAFGYFQSNVSILWSSTTVDWSDPVPWSGDVQPQFLQVIAGNQEGFTFIIDSTITTNASVLQITDITVVDNIVTFTVINHNLSVDEYIFIQDIVDSTGNLTLLNQGIFQVIDSVANPITPNQFSIIWDSPIVLVGIYDGDGLIARVSKLDIVTKEYNFYAQQGRNALVSKIDFMVDRTGGGQMQVNYFASTSDVNLLDEAAITGALIGTGNLDTFPYPTLPYEATSTRLWHPLYVSLDGEVCQLQLTMNDEQMRNPDVREADFALHALVFSAQPSSGRLQ